MYTPHVMDITTLTFRITFIIIAFLGIFQIILWVLFIKQRNAWRNFMKTPIGNNIEETISQIKIDLKNLHTHGENTDKYLENINTRMNDTVRGVGIVRYDAFNDVGGKQSFAITWLSEHGNGVIISSIYSRTRMNVYTRPIKSFKPEIELSAEESASLEQARANLKI